MAEEAIQLVAKQVLRDALPEASPDAVGRALGLTGFQFPEDVYEDYIGAHRTGMRDDAAETRAKYEEASADRAYAQRMKKAAYTSSTRAQKFIAQMVKRSEPNLAWKPNGIVPLPPYEPQRNEPPTSPPPTARSTAMTSSKPDHIASLVKTFGSKYDTFVKRLSHAFHRQKHLEELDVAFKYDPLFRREVREKLEADRKDPYEDDEGENIEGKILTMFRTFAQALRTAYGSGSHLLAWWLKRLSSHATDGAISFDVFEEAVRELGLANSALELWKVTVNCNHADASKRTMALLDLDPDSFAAAETLQKLVAEKFGETADTSRPPTPKRKAPRRKGEREAAHVPDEGAVRFAWREIASCGMDKSGHGAPRTSAEAVLRFDAFSRGLAAAGLTMDPSMESLAFYAMAREAEFAHGKTARVLDWPAFERMLSLPLPSLARRGRGMSTCGMDVTEREDVLKMMRIIEAPPVRRRRSRSSSRGSVRSLKSVSRAALLVGALSRRGSKQSILSRRGSKQSVIVKPRRGSKQSVVSVFAGDLDSGFSAAGEDPGGRLQRLIEAPATASYSSPRATPFGAQVFLDPPKAAEAQDGAGRPRTAPETPAPPPSKSPAKAQPGFTSHKRSRFSMVGGIHHADHQIGNTRDYEEYKGSAPSSARATPALNSARGTPALNSARGTPAPNSARGTPAPTVALSAPRCATPAPRRTPTPAVPPGHAMELPADPHWRPVSRRSEYFGRVVIELPRAGAASPVTKGATPPRASFRTLAAPSGFGPR